MYTKLPLKKRRSGLAAGKMNVLLLSALLLAGCNQDTSEAPVQQAQTQPPAQVEVAHVLYEDVVEWHEYTGRLEAPQTVILRPRVSGYIDKVTYEEGAYVEKGDVLFKIDPDSYQLEVDRLRAELKQAQAGYDLAAKDLTRAQSVTVKKVISVEQLDERTRDKLQAESSVAATRAALNTALLNLSYTDVKAPISGRVSRAEITAGNYVTAGDSELTSVVSTDIVYAYFDADEHAYLNYRNRHKNDTVDAIEQRIPVFMRLLNETGFPHQGYIDFVDNRVNVETGTIRARGVFSNKDNDFTPGLFARVRVASSTPQPTVLINDLAVGTDLNNKYVLVVTADNEVEYRRIELGPKQDGIRLVKSGLSPDDRIVIAGLQRIRPGSTVDPQTKPMFEESVVQEFRKSQSRITQAYQENREPEKNTMTKRDAPSQSRS